MVLDTFFYENTKVIVSYSSAWEMFFSMHVLSDPEHHVSRKNWIEAKEKCYPDLVKELRELKHLTDSWLLVIDSEKWSEIYKMEILEMLDFLKKKNIYQWNAWIKKNADLKMEIEHRNKILAVVKRYYEEIFKKEEIILRLYILRILQREKEKCQKEGLWKWCEKIHSRLKVDENEIIYRKDQEYRYEKKSIDTIVITASTFVHPHLWMSNDKNQLEIVKSILVESIKLDIPEEFANLFKVLGDKTRLKIISLLLKGVCTTKLLAKEIQLSEAAISKHLKIMWEAGLVKKQRNGFCVEYEFNMEVIDYIPYKFYETMIM